MKSSHLLAFTALLSLSGTVSAAWTRLPYAQSEPANLASKGIPGTKITSSKGVDDAAGLLLGDPAAGAHVAPGKSEFTVQLYGQLMINTVTFVNDGVEGKITCAGSSDAKNWTPLARAVFSSGDRLVPVNFASAQAKYVSISFESAQGGTIRSLQIFGAPTNKDFTVKRSSSTNNVNMAGAAADAHPIYANPSPSNSGEIGVSEGIFRFPNTGDKYRTVIYDLGASRTLREFSAAYSPRPVRLEVFAFQELPEKKDWRGKLTLDPAIFDEARPVASGEDARGLGHIRVLPGKPVTAQYIALRFEPNYMHASNGAGDFLSEARFVEGEGGFNVDGCNVGGTGYQTVPKGYGGTVDNTPGNSGNNTSGATTSSTGSTDTTGPPPYLPGTPGSPPAGSGGLPGSGTSGPVTNTTVNPVTVSASGGGGTTTPVPAGPPTGNNPTTP